MVDITDHQKCLEIRVSLQPSGMFIEWLDMFLGFLVAQITRLQICPLYIFGNKPPQMVPMDQNIGETRVWRLDSGAKSTTLNNVE